MLVVFPPIFVADTKIIHGYNFVAPLTIKKYKTTWTKIEELNGLPGFGVEFDCVLIICIDSLFVYEKKHYLQQIYLDECRSKYEEKQMMLYLDYNLIQSDKNWLVLVGFDKISCKYKHITNLINDILRKE